MALLSDFIRRSRNSQVRQHTIPLLAYFLLSLWFLLFSSTNKSKQANYLANICDPYDAAESSILLVFLIFLPLLLTTHFFPFLSFTLVIIFSFTSLLLFIDISHSLLSFIVLWHRGLTHTPVQEHWETFYPPRFLPVITRYSIMTVFSSHFCTQPIDSEYSHAFICIHLPRITLFHHHCILPYYFLGLPFSLRLSPLSNFSISLLYSIFFYLSTTRSIHLPHISTLRIIASIPHLLSLINFITLFL